jgi:DNA-damage-inducible protein D
MWMQRYLQEFVWLYNENTMTGKQMELTLFEPDDNGCVQFELLAKTNGTRYWSAREVMSALGYDNWSDFYKRVINRAIGACFSIHVRVDEHFIQDTREIGGKAVEDLKLTRFACCLISLNGDPRANPRVAAAQAYFISLAMILQDAVLDPESADRLVMREDISAREITLGKTARAAGVDSFPMFQNAGYRGMYNMNLADLRKLKGIPDMKKTLLDFMGKDELAGNLFRLTLTEGRIRKEQTRGQAALESVAEQVGRRVRHMMIDETGIAPENLPIGPDIRTIPGTLKGVNRGFGVLDDLDQQRITEQQALAGLSDRTADFFPDCAECIAGNRLSHSGSSQCTSGSIASGGSVVHCNCDYCAIPF